MSRAAFAKRFPDDAACARHLFEKRWPNGFICPKCQDHESLGTRLQARSLTNAPPAADRRPSQPEPSFIAATCTLLTWFLAIYAVASHSNGISALQLQAQLGLGSYKTAWLMLQKLRRAMVDPDRSLLEDLVEVDESDIPYRTKADPIAGGQGRSPSANCISSAPSSSRPRPPTPHPPRAAQDFSAPRIGAFIAGAVTPGATILSDGFSAYKSLKGYNHQPRSSVKWRRTSSCPGSIGSSPILNAGRSEPITASAIHTCAATSKSSFSAGIGDVT